MRRRHTLALVPSRGRVYAFGLGGAGQLGSRAQLSSATPQVVVGPWLSPSGLSILENNNILDYKVHRIYAGGDQCFVTVTRLKVSTGTWFSSRWMETIGTVIEYNRVYKVHCINKNILHVLCSSFYFLSFCSL